MCVSSRVHEARRLKPKLFSASSRASENQRGIRSFGVDDANVRRPARRASAVRDATRRLARCHEETRRDDTSFSFSFSSSASFQSHALVSRRTRDANVSRDARDATRRMSTNASGAIARDTTSSGIKTNANDAVVSDSANVARRLQSELMSLMTSADAGISAFPDGDNIFSWVGTIEGAVGTVYESLQYKLTLSFANDYPFKAPTVKFETPCFHPNVDQYGNICLDILKEKWSPVYNVRTILLSIQSLLGEPNNDSPLNVQAAQLWVQQDEYKKVLLRKYKEDTKSS